MAHYLGVLYRLGGSQTNVSVSSVAVDAEVSTPAAARMFRKLETRGLVAREPYKGVRLTSKGELRGVARNSLPSAV